MEQHGTHRAGHAYTEYVIRDIISIRETGSDTFGWALSLSENWGILAGYDNNAVTLYYPFNTAPANDSVKIINTLSTCTLQGNTYSSVSEITHTGASVNDNYFICSRPGIVKMRIFHSVTGVHRVWELCNRTLFYKWLLTANKWHKHCTLRGIVVLRYSRLYGARTKAGISNFLPYPLATV